MWYGHGHTGADCRGGWGHASPNIFCSYVLAEKIWLDFNDVDDYPIQLQEVIFLQYLQD